MALREGYRGLGGELVERRRRLRILFVAGTGGYLAAVALVQGYNLLLGASTPRVLVLGNLALIWVFALWTSGTLVRVRPGSWLEASPGTAPPTVLPAAEARILAALQQALERDRIYRDEDLTIGALSGRLGTREQVLRRVINQGLGYRNFNDFLHHYRIREACARLQRSEDAHLPVLSIALDVGYGSIGPFNRAFKARVGMTPTAFRRSSPAAAARPA
jgi:AraC-like DNA-binding protein